MKRLKKSRLSSVKTWSNDPTGLSACAAARAYATGIFSGKELELALMILDKFKGSPTVAKQWFERRPISEFRDAQSYFRWKQFGALFLKSSDGGSDEQRKLRAISAFESAERRCAITNRRLRYYGARPNRENPVYRVLLCRARNLISRTLGHLDEDTLEQIYADARPGSGSAIGTASFMRTSLPFKLGETKLVCTGPCLPYARALVEGSPAWTVLAAEVDWERCEWSVPYITTDANRISFVPKDATTLRTIAVEPHLNVCLQLGVHAYIARRLRGVGIDIGTQFVNQTMAFIGSKSWESSDPLTTLDLSSASDTVSLGLVERLLPTDWRGLLDDFRSPRYRLGKETREFHKWSSMGNGYTFALETLIFWALAKACLTMTRGTDYVTVYGDDIVLPRQAAALFTELLKYCGFVVNTSKSFIFGPFRESCGEDYWSAERVVPMYLRELSHLAPTDMYRLVNRLGPLGLVTQELQTACLTAHRGRAVLYGVPRVNGDDGETWWAPFSFVERQGLIRFNHQYQCYEQRVAVYRPRKRRHPATWGYAAALLGSRADPVVEDEFAVRSALRGRGVWSLLCVSVM